MAQYRQPVSYGLTQALINDSPFPVQSRRAPTASDTGFLPGTIWINKVTQLAYVLVAIVNNAAVWLELVYSGGPGVFSTLVSTAQFNLDTTAVGANTLGNTTGATSLAISVGTGGFSVTGVTNSAFVIGTGLTTGTILIGGAAQSGAITIGSSTAAQTVNIASGSTASKTVNIASGTAGNTVSINNGVNTVANVTNIASGASAANNTVNIMAGTPTAGTATLNLATGDYPFDINIGTGDQGNIVNINTGDNLGALVTNIASGASAADNTVNIMSGLATAGTSTLNLATGAYAHAINMGTGAAVVNTIAIGGTGANVIAIGDTQAAGSVSIGAAMTTGTLNFGGTGLQTGTVTIAGGTGAQAINIAAAGTGTKTIAIGANGSQANVTIGSTFAGSTVTLNTPTGTAIASANGFTATAGNITATNGNVVLSASASYVSLPGPVFLYSGAGAPSNGLALHTGDTYFRTDAGGATERIYVATGVGAWTNVTCAA